MTYEEQNPLPPPDSLNELREWFEKSYSKMSHEEKLKLRDVIRNSIKDIIGEVDVQGQPTKSD